MIVFEEEIKKFHPCLEVGELTDAIYNQDMTDMAEVLVNVVRDAKDEADTKNNDKE
ncbi:MAG: hypothetical protein K5682_05135 [Lachnospiraceae bacterium]|nr:hypothetical protein [Lachnospiraceae bacterium]